MRPFLRAALLNPAALALLSVSVLLALALLVVPVLSPLSGQAIWVMLLGIAGYVGVVGMAYGTRSQPSAPELGYVRQIRHGIAALLAARRVASDTERHTVVLGVLSTMLRRLDDQIIPAVQQLVRRRAELDQAIGRDARPEVGAPTLSTTEQLRQMRAGVQVAIDMWVQQATDAYAAPVAFLKEGGDAAALAAWAEAWADDLRMLHASLAEVLRGEAFLADAEERSDSTSDGPR